METFIFFTEFRYQIFYLEQNGILFWKTNHYTVFLPLIAGTLKVTFIAVIVAVPFGIGSAIFLSEYATDRTYEELLKPILEVLAGVPTIVYGFFALTFVTPIVATIYSVFKNL